VALHDLHESIPLLQSWNGTGPWNPNLDPIVVSELFDMSFAEVRDLTASGMPGVWTWAFGEGFGHHYTESVATNHNAIGRGYETFGNASAETMARNLRDRKYTGRRVTGSEWYRPLPPPRTFTWSLRNNTNYMQAGCLSVLTYTANNAKAMLRAFYRKGYNSWQKGLTEKPFAVVIPDGQGDRRRVAELVNLLRAQQIEVARAAADITVKEGTFPKGSYVVRLDQPYRNYAVDLLLPQSFPSDAEHQPYDDISWALPVHYGLEAKRIDDETIRQAPLERVLADIVTTGAVTGTGAVYLLKDTGQEALLAARARLAAFEIGIAAKAFTAGGAEYPAGSWVIRDQPGLAAALEEVARELALDFTAATEAPADLPMRAAPVPRLAVWHAWADTQAAGWLRLTLDRQKVPYRYISDDDIKAGALDTRFDVVIWPETESDLQEQIHGIDRRWSPMPYTTTAEFPTHGLPDASDDITGGIGWKGLANLQQFVERGGLLITLGNGSALALDGGVVRGVSHAPGGSSVWTPGVELKATFLRPDHPVAYGYTPAASVFRGSFTAYRVRPADQGWVVLQWGSKPPKEDRDPAEEKAASGKGQEKEDGKGDAPMVVSGGAKGEDGLEGRPAILDIPLGKGHVVAYNFNPMHRDLNRSDYRLLWNAILNWQALVR
jgi:hypothetical protein